MNNPFMERAIRLAIDNVQSAGGGPFGALVVRNGEVLSQGVNRVTASNDPTAHAEIVAIREACRALATFQLTDCDLYASCEPCPMCLGAIYWARLGHLYFASTREDAATAGFDDSLIYREVSLEPSARLLPATQLMREQASAAFDAWAKSESKVRY